MNRRIFLAIDDLSLPLRRSLCLHLTRPNIRTEPVLSPRRNNPASPDQLAALFYGTVLHEGGKYRMWYHAVAKGIDTTLPPKLKIQLNPKSTLDMSTGPICYAQSDDGIHWERPELGLCHYKGKTNTNALSLDLATTIGAAILRDDLDPDHLRRYKAVFNYYDYQPGSTPAEQWGAMRTATSPDGLNWTTGGRDPIGTFFEANGFYRFNNQYIVIGQKTSPFTLSEGAHPSGRQAYAHLSTDFNHWEAAQADAFLLPEPLNPEDRGIFKPYDQVHVGIGAAVYDNVTVGLYGLWHNLPDFGQIGCDLGLVISNDGIHYREPAKGIPFIRQEDSPLITTHGLPTKLTQGNGILNVGDQTLIYHGRWTEGRMADKCSESTGWGFHPEFLDDYFSEIALASIDRDRWGAMALYPDQSEGYVWSMPIRLPDNPRDFKVTLNATGVAGLSVDLAGEDFQPIAQFQGGRCSGGDSLDAEVRWDGPISMIAGHTIRLRIRFSRTNSTDPRLYAINLIGV
ncbi:MAG: hypothetical protein IT447_00245 [Phycisphaerales bacterium]|jgi:hypothetical protein|nr:hypothetical protein [Phycisphaerales bacterium]